MSPCISSINLLNCVPVNGQSVLYAYPTVSCSSAAYAPWRAVGIAVLLLAVVGFPAFILAFALRNFAALQTYEARRGSMLAAVYEGYQSKVVYWEAVSLLRRVAYVALAASLVEQPAVRASTLTLVIALCLALQVQAHPYAQKHDNRLETYLLVNALVFSVYVSPTATDASAAALSVCLLALGCLPFLGVLVWTAAESYGPQPQEQEREQDGGVHSVAVRWHAGDCESGGEVEGTRECSSEEPLTKRPSDMQLAVLPSPTAAAVAAAAAAATTTTATTAYQHARPSITSTRARASISSRSPRRFTSLSPRA